MIVIKLLSVILLIFLTAFFVASEFSLVKVRRSQMESKALDGNPKADRALILINNLDDYLSACQLGITITSLGLGWLGEPAVATILQPLFHAFHLSSTASHTISFLIGFSAITFLEVVLGELVPKTLAIQKAEAITFLIARPLIIFHKIAFPFIWVLNGSANLFVRVLGLKTAKEQEEVHSEDELRYILSQSYQKGEINQSEYKFVDNIFEFDNRLAKEVMVPRTEMVVFDQNEPIKQVVTTMKDERYTRYPVIDGDKDHILGLIHMKELFYSDCEYKQPIKDFIRPILKVFENIPIYDLLIKMQREQIHMAILLDEYGGTSGLVTVEDIIEEIVGEIRDEFDQEEELPYRKIASDHYLLNGKVSIQDVNELLKIELEHDNFDTIAGWIFTRNVEATEGTVIKDGDYFFKVKKKEDAQIKRVEVFRVPDKE